MKNNLVDRNHFREEVFKRDNQAVNNSHGHWISKKIEINGIKSV